MRPRTVVPTEPRRTSIWTALVLITSLVAAFVITASFMIRNHEWTDTFLAELPAPGARTSLAADPALAGQMRMLESDAWFARLADQTPALIAETVIVNDALVPVTNVVVEAVLMEDGNRVRTAHVGCGKPVSDRLIGRLRREELRALSDLGASAGEIATGEQIRCQVAFARMKPGPDEVVFRIASVEPLPGHSPPLFLPGG